MKILIPALFLFLNFIQPLDASNYGNGYAYKRTITIDHTKVGSASTVWTYSTAGTFTWVAPPGVTSVSVEAWGGGGTGGSATGNPARGGGGAGGQYAIKQVAVTPGTSYTIVVAAASTASTNGVVNGKDSTFNTNVVVAKGGAGGLVSSGTSNTGGVGATTGGVGDTVYAGGSGGAGTAGGSSGGGGGGAGSTGTGNSGVTSTAGIAKANGGGAGGTGVAVANTNNPGNTAGGGGSGGLANSGTNRAGGNGAIGQVQLTYTDTLSNFPVLISGTYSYLATVAHGGRVTNASGYDIIFTSDAAGLNKLNWEIESYNATTGTVDIWVQVPTVSSSSDTTIYMFYGRSNISTFQSTASSTWDSNYQSVWHLPDGTTLSTNDSTSTAHNGSNSNATAVSGQIDGAAGFNGTTSYIDSSNYADNLSNFSASAWFNTSASQSGFGSIIISKAGSGGIGSGNGWFFDIAGPSQAAATLDHINFTIQNGGGATYVAEQSSVSVNDGNWHYVVANVTNSGQTYANVTLFLDGALVGTNNYTGGAWNTSGISNTSNVRAGNDYNSELFNGTIDELRVSSATREKNWVLAEYNNQNSPSTFYTVGNEITGPDNAIAFASE